jgi:hypothetical protein
VGLFWAASGSIWLSRYYSMLLALQVKAVEVGKGGRMRLIEGMERGNGWSVCIERSLDFGPLVRTMLDFEIIYSLNHTSSLLRILRSVI